MPCSTISGLPPTAVTTTGSADAIASSSVSDAASVLEVRAKTSAACRMSGTSSRTPRNLYSSRYPKRLALRNEGRVQRTLARQEQIDVR